MDKITAEDVERAYQSYREGNRAPWVERWLSSDYHRLRAALAASEERERMMREALEKVHEDVTMAPCGSKVSYHIPKETIRIVDHAIALSDSKPLKFEASLTIPLMNPKNGALRPMSDSKPEDNNLPLNTNKR